MEILFPFSFSPTTAKSATDLLPLLVASGMEAIFEGDPFDNCPRT